MKKINLLKAGIISYLVFPAISFAALADIKTIAGDLKAIFKIVYPLVGGLALLFFIWNMSQVILKAGDAKAKEEARNKMIWGIIAIFIIFSIVGIVNFIGSNLGVDVGGTFDLDGF
jgi:hypothetical protein